MITEKGKLSKHAVIDNDMVGMRGLEPRTSSLSEKRSNHPPRRTYALLKIPFLFLF